MYVRVVLFSSSSMNTLPFFVTFCVGTASICIHTQIMRAHASLARVVKILSHDESQLLSLALALHRVVRLPSHLPRVPRGLFKSKTSLSQTERILVSETLIITTWRCPDSRLFVRPKGRSATSGRWRTEPEKNGDENGLALLEAVSSALLTINLFKRRTLAQVNRFLCKRGTYFAKWYERG